MIAVQSSFCSKVCLYIAWEGNREQRQEKEGTQRNVLPVHGPSAGADITRGHRFALTVLSAVDRHVDKLAASQCAGGSREW